MDLSRDSDSGSNNASSSQSRTAFSRHSTDSNDSAATNTSNSEDLSENSGDMEVEQEADTENQSDRQMRRLSQSMRRLSTHNEDDGVGRAGHQENESFPQSDQKRSDPGTGNDIHGQGHTVCSLTA